MFVSNMTELANNREKTVPEGYYDALIKVVDLLQKLDNLKVCTPKSASLCVCAWNHSLAYSHCPHSNFLRAYMHTQDMKPSLKDDFARYKRVFNSVRQDLPNAMALLKEQNDIQCFLSGISTNASGMSGNRKLGQQLQIIANLIVELKSKVPNYDDILCEMLEQCQEYLEEQRYTTLGEKYRYLRALPHIMLMIDTLLNYTEASN